MLCNKLLSAAGGKHLLVPSFPCHDYNNPVKKAHLQLGYWVWTLRIIVAQRNPISLFCSRFFWMAQLSSTEIGAEIWASGICSCNEYSNHKIDPSVPWSDFPVYVRHFYHSCFTQGHLDDLAGDRAKERDVFLERIQDSESLDDWWLRIVLWWYTPCPLHWQIRLRCGCFLGFHFP